MKRRNIEDEEFDVFHPMKKRNMEGEFSDEFDDSHSMESTSMEDEFSDEFNDDPFEHFIHSIKIGNIEDVKYYFKEEFSNRTDKYGLQPIHWASLSYNVDILKFLLKKNCNIESANRNGWRPINFATFVGDEEMVKCLIKNYCKLDCPTDKGETISDVANGKFEHEFIDEILNETNLKVALSMGLKCGVDCDHKLCLTSVARGKFGKGEFIGWSLFGDVFKVRDSQSDRIFAVRIIKDGFDDRKCIMSNINRYLTKMDHENIIKYYGMIETLTKWKIFIEWIKKIETPTKWNIFMEWMEKGSLLDEIKSTGSLSDDKIARYSKDILRAVAFLHQNEIIHQDINPKKILIDSNGRCKLSLSPFSRFLENGKIAYTFCGTMEYMAPEKLNFEEYNCPADIWSVGATLIHMFTGHPPYDGLKLNAVMHGIGTNKKLEYTLPRPISNEMQQFINDMTKPEPEERATADELLNYELIRNASINWEINNSNTDQSIIDYSIINRQSCSDLIKRTINNQQIGISMGLKCPDGCKHEFCLSSVTATNFKKDKKIGEGAGGKVYKIELKSVVHWAMKIIKDVDDENIKKEVKYFEEDINRYREFINHDNIVKYFGAVRNFQEIFIFMEFIDGDSLYQKIKKNKYNPLPLTTIKQYTKQVLEGLKFLHNKNIIHRDIKSKNILINKNNIVKIADFGVSRFLRTISKHQKKTFCGTYNYISPEVFNDEPYDISADIWSLGATVFEMATGHPPYHEMHVAAMIFKIGNDKTIEYPSNMSDDIKRFLNLMINAVPKNRSSADSLLSCEFFK